MGCERLYQLLQPEAPGTPARVFRGVHHTMVAAGIAIMLADTVAEWRLAWAAALDGAFQIVCGFFFARIRPSTDRGTGRSWCRAAP